jgi:V/A-type H+-transporting ATPase subunit E
MSENIESFVKKLQQDGVQAGKAEAEKVLAGARAEAGKIVDGARREAQTLLEQARRDADTALKDGRTQLELGSRDALLQLREAIVRTLEAVLHRAASSALSDPAFLKTLLQDVVAQYARKDAEGIWPIRVEVGESAAKSLADWAIREMAGPANPGESRVALGAALKEAGFEYTAANGKVEVTPGAVAAALKTFVAPRLREILEQASAAGKK